MRNIAVITIGIVLAAYILFFGWFYDGRRAGDAITDELNAQIKAGDFEKIYSEMSEGARFLTPRDEFISNMNRVVVQMKAYDDSLGWKQGNLQLSNEVYADLYFVHREIEKDGKRLDITVTISRSMLWQFYDLCVMPSESSTDQVCVTNALRKV